MDLEGWPGRLEQFIDLHQDAPYGYGVKLSWIQQYMFGL